MDFENPTPPSENSESGATLYDIAQENMAAADFSALEKRIIAWQTDMFKCFGDFIVAEAEKTKAVGAFCQGAVKAGLQQYQRDLIEHLIEHFHTISDRQAVLNTAGKRVALGCGRLGTYRYLRTLHVEKRLAKWASRKAHERWVRSYKRNGLDFCPYGPLKNPNIVVEDLAY